MNKEELKTLKKGALLWDKDYGDVVIEGIGNIEFIWAWTHGAWEYPMLSQAVDFKDLEEAELSSRIFEGEL